MMREGVIYFPLIDFGKKYPYINYELLKIFATIHLMVILRNKLILGFFLIFDEKEKFS